MKPDEKAAAEALQKLNDLVYDYADGVGNSGEILSQFSTVLARFKKNYYLWSPKDFSKPPSEAAINSGLDKNKSRFIKRMIAAGISLAVMIIGVYVLPFDVVFKFIAYVAAGVVLGISIKDPEPAFTKQEKLAEERRRAENNSYTRVYTENYEIPVKISYIRRHHMWAIIPFLGLFPIYLLSGAIKGADFSIWPEVIFICIFVITFVLRFFYNKSQYARERTAQLEIWNLNKTQQGKIKEQLSADQTELKNLLPALKREFEEKLQAAIQKYRCILPAEVIENYRSMKFPKEFWWTILPQELYALEQAFEEEGFMGKASSRWETDWFQRDDESAYEGACSEYSPLYPYLSDKMVKKMSDYLEDENDSIDSVFYDYLIMSAEAQAGALYIIDFITSTSKIETKSETISYRMPKYDHAKLDKADELNFWTSVSADKAFQNGHLSEQDYHAINTDLLFLDMKSSQMRRETVIAHEEEYYQEVTYTNLWSGQMLLLPDGAEDSDDFALYDYRAPMFFVFKNLNALKGFHITRVYGDTAARNPLVLSKIHRMCPNCR